MLPTEQPLCSGNMFKQTGLTDSSWATQLLFLALPASTAALQPLQYRPGGLTYPVQRRFSCLEE
jgi:hypothetical protein